MNHKAKLGDLIDVRKFCESMGYPYYGALYVGIGEDVKPASCVKDLDGYPLILKWFCNHRYEVIKADAKEKITYAVASFRDYGDNEIYFSTDGLFDTEKEAKDFVEKEIKSLSEEYLEDKSSAMVDPWDGSGCRWAQIGGYRFAWYINRFYKDNKTKL